MKHTEMPVDQPPIISASSGGPSRSPSAIPHLPPGPKAPEPSATQSTMLSTLLPGDLHEPAPDSNMLQNMEEEHPLSRPHPGEELVLALPMGGSQRDSYGNPFKEVLKNKGSLVPAFLENPHNGTRDEVLKLLTKLDDILLHRDLEYKNVLSQVDVPDSVFADWSETSTVKFKFLAELLRRYDGPPREIAVFVKPGDAYNMVVSYFKGSQVTTYSDFAGDDPVSLGERALTIRVYSTQSPPKTLPRQIFAVIGLDSTFYPGFVQSNFAGSNEDAVKNLPPSIRLLIANSIEHFERWIPQKMEDTERLQTLVQAVAQFKTMCGIVPNNYPRAHTSKVKDQILALVEDVVAFLKNSEEGNDWPELDMFPEFEKYLDSSTSTTDGESTDQQSGDSPSRKRRSMVSIQLSSFLQTSNADSDILGRRKRASEKTSAFVQSL